MTVDADTLQLNFPEFAAVDDDVVTAMIEKAERRTARDAWGVKADDGVELLACHLLALRARAEAAGGASYTIQGAVTSERVGPLARSFGSVDLGNLVPWSDAWYQATGYGAEYVNLRSLIFAPRVL